MAPWTASSSSSSENLPGESWTVFIHSAPKLKSDEWMHLLPIYMHTMQNPLAKLN